MNFMRLSEVFSSKTLDCLGNKIYLFNYLHATLKNTGPLEIDPAEFVPLHTYCPAYERFTGAEK